MAWARAARISSSEFMLCYRTRMNRDPRCKTQRQRHADPTQGDTEQKRCRPVFARGRGRRNFYQFVLAMVASSSCQLSVKGPTLTEQQRGHEKHQANIFRVCTQRRHSLLIRAVFIFHWYTTAPAAGCDLGRTTRARTQVASQQHMAVSIVVPHARITFISCAWK